MKIKLGISACLLGKNVRYDGGHKLHRWIKETLSKDVNFLMVCPESECGMATPRPPMYITEDGDNPRLIITETGYDVTAEMQNFINFKLKEIKKASIDGFILKSRSPSCELKGINKPIGLFAKRLREEFPYMPMIDEVDIDNLEMRNKFLNTIKELGKNRAP